MHLEPDSKRSGSPSPPPYDVPDDTRKSQSTDDATPKSPNPTPPMNFVSIVRVFQPINETYTIDPSIKISNSTLVGEDTSRDNLFLKVHNAQIDVDVGLVSVPTEALEDQITVQSGIGDITVRLRSSPHPRPPFKISIEAGWGTVFVSLPRSFQGALNTTSRGPLIFSEEFSKVPPRTLSEQPCGLVTQRKLYMGDSALDEVNIKSMGGRIYVWYDNESYEKPQLDFWTRFFGV